MITGSNASKPAAGCLDRRWAFSPKSPGARPFIIPVFVPHGGCPHQCAFCNQQAITGASTQLPSPETVHGIISSYLRYRRAARSGVQIAFFGGNFLGLDRNQVMRMLAVARQYICDGMVDSIRFSTRPDTITPRRLAWLQDYPVGTIELGVQSMDSRVLACTKRGHRAADTTLAVERLRCCPYEIGLQMMIGLPGEDRHSSLRTGQALVDLKPDFVRIYPTLVLKNSLLARWYNDGTFRPLSLEQAVQRTKRLYLMFQRHRIPVVRMGLQASAGLDAGGDLLAGPYHPAFGHLVHAAIFLDRAIGALSDLRGNTTTICIYTHPASIPQMRGLNNRNVILLKKKFHINTLNIHPDQSLNRDELKITSSCIGI